MGKIETWQEKTKTTTVRLGDTQVDVSDWANLEGVQVGVVSKDRATILSGSMTWEELEALVAALSLHKTEA